MRRGSWPLALLAALLPVLLFVIVAWLDYRAETIRARDHVTSTTDALAEHAQMVAQTADLVLARVLEHVEPLDWQAIGQSQEVHDFLLARQHELDQFESIFLVAPDGLNAATSRIYPVPPIYDDKREYFQHALQGRAGLFFSEPFKSAIAGTWSFVITRPRLKDGRFDGLAGVTVSASYLEAFYRAVSEYPDQSTATLTRDDGTLLVRYPQLAQPPARLPASSPLMIAAASGAPSGLFEGTSSLDGHPRLAAFKRLAGVPLLVSYALDRSVYLREWYIHLAFLGFITLLSSAAIVYAGRSMLRNAAQENAALRRLVEETHRREQAEAALQQSQKLEALGRLTGGVAHDFNNLLGAILGSLDLLQKHLTDPKPLRLLSTARKAVERGAQLTAQMLAFARRQEVVIRAVDVNRLLRGAEDLVRGAVGPMITVHYQLADGLPLATADATQLEVAVLNLALNGRDAMPDGGELTIATSAASIGEGSANGAALAPGTYIRLSVTDTGEGMSEEVRRQAFDPFFTTKGPGRGTGLGLSMVFGLATSVGGTVALESAPGKGTTVSVLLPQSASGMAAAGLAEAARERPPERQGGSRILVVDDDDRVRATTRAMLEDLGHEVVEASGGMDALLRLRSDRRFDVLLIDYAMPEMNGSALAHEIRALWPEAPLLFMTGYVDSDSLRSWTERGVCTLRKPFSLDELADAVSAPDRAAPSPARVGLRG